MLSVAAKLSIFLTRLSPQMPDGSGALDDGAPLPVISGVVRAERGHRVLTGLLAGFSLSAALGTVLTIADRPADNTWVRFAFAAAIAVALIFRASQQRGIARRALVLVAGLISGAAAFALVVDFGSEARILGMSGRRRTGCRSAVSGACEFRIAAESVRTAWRRSRRLSRSRGGSTDGRLDLRRVRPGSRFESGMSARPARVAGAIVLTSAAVWMSPHSRGGHPALG